MQELVNEKSRKGENKFWHDQSTKDTDHCFWKQEYLLKLDDSPLWNHTGLPTQKQNKSILNGRGLQGQKRTSRGSLYLCSVGS